MPLLKAFAKVDQQGKIHLPANVRRLTGFAPGERVEIRLQGAAHRLGVFIHQRRRRKVKLRTRPASIPVAFY